MRAFKEFCKDFPTQGGQVVVALFLIIITGLLVAGRLAWGLKFPDGYEAWLMFLGALAGIANIGMIGKRATDIGYAQAKNPGGPAVNVEAATTVRATGDVSIGKPTNDVPKPRNTVERPAIVPDPAPADGAVG